MAVLAATSIGGDDARLTAARSRRIQDSSILDLVTLLYLSVHHTHIVSKRPEEKAHTSIRPGQLTSDQCGETNGVSGYPILLAGIGCRQCPGYYDQHATNAILIHLRSLEDTVRKSCLAAMSA